MGEGEGSHLVYTVGAVQLSPPAIGPLIDPPSQPRAMSDERRKRRTRRASAAAEGEEVLATGAVRNREGVK